MLFHELAVFAYVPLLTAILLYPQWTRAKRVTACAVYVAATGVCVFGVYLLAYASTDHRVYPTLLSWASSYASDSTFTTSWKQLAGPYLSTYIKLFGGGKLTFIREYLSIPVCAGLAASIAALVIGVVLLRRPKAVAAIYLDRRALTVLWVWLVSYGIFLTCWDAGSAFHKLFLWPAIVLLPGIYIARKPHLRERAKAFVAFALALASWNFAAFIYPHSHASADPVLGLAQAVNRQLPRNAVVYYKVLDPDDWYLEYFAPGRRWLPLPLRVDQATLRDSASGPVCFETTALSNLSGSEFRDSIEPRLKWELVNNRHNIRLECLAPRVTRPDSGHPESFLR